MKPCFSRKKLLGLKKDNENGGKLRLPCPFCGELSLHYVGISLEAYVGTSSGGNDFGFRCDNCNFYKNSDFLTTRTKEQAVYEYSMAIQRGIEKHLKRINELVRIMGMQKSS